MAANVHEVAGGICRISAAVAIGDLPGGFTVNQYLVAGEKPAALLRALAGCLAQDGPAGAS